MFHKFTAFYVICNSVNSYLPDDEFAVTNISKHDQGEKDRVSSVENANALFECPCTDWQATVLFDNWRDVYPINGRVNYAPLTFHQRLGHA